MRPSALLSIPLVLLLAGEALAQCRVEGVVRSADGTPRAGATVQIQGPEFRKPLTTTTGADGRYVFDDVKAGTRVRIVVSQGGRPIAEEFALVTLWVETIDIRERSAPSAPTSSADLDPAGGPSGEVGGVVRSVDGLAVPAARIRINETTLTAATDSAGRYVLGRLRAGIGIQLQVSAPGFKPAAKEVIVPGADRLEVDFALEAAPAAEPAGADLSGPDTVAASSRVAARPEQVAGIPSLGQKDLFRALQFLPGVAGSPESPADLYVRGGTPDQSLVTFDGYSLYQFDRGFGALSPYNMDAIQKAEFSRSAFSAADGGRLSGVLRLTGQSNATGEVTGAVNLSMLGVGAHVSAPIGDRVSFFLAARRSPPTTLYNDVLDLFAGGGGVSARDRIARFSGGTFLSSPTSSFQDLNGKIELKPTAKDRVSLSLYDGRDAINNSRDLPFQASTSSMHAVEGFELPTDTFVQVCDIGDSKARGISGTWTRLWSPAASTTVSVGRSEFSRDGDQAWLLTSPSTGEDYSLVTGRGGSDGLAESNRILDTTVRVDTQFGIGFEHALSIGGEISAITADYTIQREVFRQSGVGGRLTSGLVNLLRQEGSGRLTTVYAQDVWRPVARLVVSPGIRVTRYDLAGETYFEPRVGASYQLTRQLRLKGGWAIDHQMANRIAREDRMHGDGAFWAAADGSTIPVARAHQVVGGGSVEIRDFLFDVELYHKTLDDLTLFAPRLYPGVAPEEGSDLLHYGSATARGLEGLLQKKTDRNTFWASYTLSRVEYAYPTLEATAFPASHDQTHEFKVADTARIGARWTVSGAWVVGTGRPYTPTEAVEQVWFPTGATVYQVTFGSKNSERLPLYHRLDLSTQRDFSFRAVRSTLGVTVFNVYDRKNFRLVDAQAAGSLLTVNGLTLMGRAVNVFVRIGF